jgi:hypothetical protein
LSGLFASTSKRDKTDPRARVLKENQGRGQVETILFRTVTVEALGSLLDLALHACTRMARLLSTTRDFLTRPPTGTSRRASSPGEGLPILYTSLWRSGRGCPLLRASDEHSFIVRVLRARRAPGRSSLVLPIFHQSIPLTLAA